MAEQSLKEKTAKGLFWGGVSSGAQQLIGALFGIFFARLLSREDYGLVGMLAIFTGVVAVLQNSGFISALINKKDAGHKDYNAVFWFSTAVGILSYVVLFLCAPLIANFFHAEELKNASRVLFLWFLVGGLCTSHNAILSKKMMVKERANIMIISLLLSNTVGLTLALLGFAYWALILQTVLHYVIGTALTWHYVKWRPTFSFDIQPLKEMFPFSCKVLITGLFSVMNANIFSVLLGRFYTKSELGDYTQGNKWAFLGYTFINNSLTGIVHPVLAEVSDDRDRLRNVFRKMVRFVSFVSFPCMLGLAFIAKEFIVVTVSDKWLPSVPIMQLLCIWGAFIPIVSLYSYLFISKGKSDINMWSSVAIGLLQLLIAWLMLPHGILHMVLAYVSTNILSLFVLHAWVRQQIGYRFLDLLKDILPFILITLLVLSGTYFATQSVTNLYLLLSLKIVLAASLYVLILKVIKVSIFKESIEYLLKRKNGKRSGKGSEKGTM